MHVVVVVGTELLGRRVALRFHVGEREGRPLFRDAVGELSADGTDTVVVATRKGPVRVPRAEVVAVRAVPPAPQQRASLAAITRLEQLCADAWPAQVDVPLGRWRLRAAGCYTARANSALVVGDPGMPLPAALDRLRVFAAEHAIPARVQVPVGTPWDRAIEREGWELEVEHAAGPEVAVLVAPLAARPDPRVELLARPDDAWWQLVQEAAPSAAQRHVIEAPAATFGLVRGGAAVRAAVVDEHLHLSVLTVAPHARRRGLATAVMGAVAAWGRDRGARWSVVQVALQNSGARAFYDRLGHTEHHRYRYLRAPA